MFVQGFGEPIDADSRLHRPKALVSCVAAGRRAGSSNGRDAFPAIRAEAKAAGAVIYFGGEAGMRLDHHASTN